MKTILRNAILVAGAAAAVATSTPVSASNHTDATFYGEATIGCFGCGTYGPTGNGAKLWVNGTVAGASASADVTDPTDWNAEATFTVNEPAGVTCLVSGTASGTVTVQTSAGAKSADFTWTRIGNQASISIPSWNATGRAAFKAPAGNPCGGPVTATVAGYVRS